MAMSRKIISRKQKEFEKKKAAERAKSKGTPGGPVTEGAKGAIGPRTKGEINKIFDQEARRGGSKRRVVKRKTGRRGRRV